MDRPAAAPIVLALLGLVACASRRESAPATPASRIELAMEHAGRGDLPGATEAAREAVRLAEARPEPRTDEVVRTQLVLSSLLLQSGERDEARALAEEAHASSLELLKEARSRVATTFKYLGNFDLLAGRLDEAEASFTAAVELAEEAYGPDDPETAKHVGNQAAVALAKEENERAAELLERTLAIWDAQPAPDPVYTVTALTNLAHLRTVQGEGEAALELFDRALRIQEQAFGPESPRLAGVLRKYAAALRAAGDEAGAAELEQRIAGLGR